MRWFRLYTEILDDPKVLALTDRQFRFWVNILAVARENDGLIPPLTPLKRRLKARSDHVERGLSDLTMAGLIVAMDEGFMPNGWGKRQYVSDVSTNRVRAHRARRNVSSTVSETPPDNRVQITENRKKEPPPIPPPADGHANPNEHHASVGEGGFDFGNGVGYAWQSREAGWLRLTAEDLERWEQAFPRIDVRAELEAMASWLASPKVGRSKWFHAAASTLVKRNREGRRKADGMQEDRDRRALMDRIDSDRYYRWVDGEPTECESEHPDARIGGRIRNRLAMECRSGA